MGKKEPQEATQVAKEESDEEEDTPIVKELKKLDEKYCAIEIELEAEIQKLRKKYDEEQSPLLEERRKVLQAEADAKDSTSGTPACPDFWVTALQNSEITECINDEGDEAVLKYLIDITKSHPDPDCPQKGTRIEFHFKENPYFDHKVLSVEIVTDYDVATYKPWQEVECIEIKGCTIDWKKGKNPTVAKKEVKAKKGSKRPPKTTEAPCMSFFRFLFTSYKKDDDLPEGLECIYSEDMDDEDDDMGEMHLSQVGGMVDVLEESILPYAVRYYTGEASPDDDDDSDEESEEESDDDDDEEDSDEESEEAPKPKGGKKAAGKKDGAGGEKQEECKQQ